VIEVERVAAADAEIQEAVGRLLPQLTQGPLAVAPAALLADPAVTLLAARRDGALVGMATVAVFAKLTGWTARLEDVVVDEAARGTGAGEALVRAAVAVARDRGASRMELTSGPWREAANRLYARLGFARRETNVYSLDL
jgi:GNAT superfamily N-acetyltransferase